MRNNCCIRSCKCSKKNCNLSAFPRSDRLSKIWLNLVAAHSGALNVNYPRSNQICIHHFEPKYLYIKKNKKKRKLFACPTLFTPEEIASKKPEKAVKLYKHLPSSIHESPAKTKDSNSKKEQTKEVPKIICSHYGEVYDMSMIDHDHNYHIKTLIDVQLEEKSKEGTKWIEMDMTKEIPKVDCKKIVRPILKKKKPVPAHKPILNEKRPIFKVMRPISETVMPILMGATPFKTKPKDVTSETNYIHDDMMNDEMINDDDDETEQLISVGANIVFNPTKEIPKVDCKKIERPILKKKKPVPAHKPILNEKRPIFKVMRPISETVMPILMGATPFKTKPKDVTSETNYIHNDMMNDEMINDDDETEQLISVGANIVFNPLAEENPRSEGNSRPVLHHVGFLKQKLVSVLYCEQFCALCCDSDKPLKLLREQILIITDNWTQTTTLKQLYQYVLHQKAEPASEYICTDCSEQLKQSYIFIKYSKLTTKLLESYINDLKLISDENEHMVANYIEKDKFRFTVMLLKGQQAQKYLPNEKKKTNEKEITNDNLNKTQETFGCEEGIEIPETSKTINAELIPLEIPDGTFQPTSIVTRKRGVKTRPRCEICSKVCNSQSKLLEHCTRIHLKVRCKICHTFIDEKDFQQHLSTEHKNKVHFCKLCVRPFYNADSVFIHKKIVHENSVESVLCLADYGLDLNCPACDDITSCIHKKYLYSVMDHKLNHKSAKVKCPDCDYVTRWKTELLTHVNKHHLKRDLYICSQCGKQFFDKKAMDEHNRKYHSSVLYCSYCDCVCSSDGALAAHEADCSATTRAHCCQYCAASFHTFKLLQKHHNTRHKETFPCNFCNKLFQTENRRIFHINKVHSLVDKPSRQKATCKMCHDVFDLRQELIHHMKIHQGPDAKYNCKLCETEFESLETLQSHNKSQHDNTTAVCNICGKKIYQNLLAHLQEHELYDAKVSCEDCGRSFTNIKHLHRHSKTHVLTKKSLKCKLCPYVAGKLTYLDGHVNKYHLNTKPYVCDKCGTRYHGKHYFLVHSKICQNKAGDKIKLLPRYKKYKCTLCPYVAAHREYLDTHVNRDHAKIKPYACDKCERRFHGKRYLVAHVKICQNKPRCDVCNREMCSMESLKIHKNSHVAEKQFKCEECGNMFVSAEARGRHHNKQHAPKNIPCSHCPLKFATSRKLQWHMNIFHQTIIVNET